jgi:hypothetical protein
MRSLALIGIACLATALAACGSSGGGEDATPDAFVIGDDGTGVEAESDLPGDFEGGDEDDATPGELPGDDVPVEDPPWTDATDTIDATEPEPQPLVCMPGSYSILPGVSIKFTGTVCSWLLSEALAGIEIPYELVVEADVPFVKPKPQDAGGCDKPGDSGLILFEELKGGQSHYCVCDTGLCQAPSDTSVTIKKGTYPGKFAWDGLNWEGPSDTGNPKGKPFPEGKYTLTVSAKGQAKLYGGTVYQDFEVSGTWPVELRPDPLPELPDLAPDLPPQDFFIPAPDETPEGATTE